MRKCVLANEVAGEELDGKAAIALLRESVEDFEAKGHARKSGGRRP
ncbi:MAG: hypothetical protein ABSE73_20715 [Planctomycetota bacterium]